MNAPTPRPAPVPPRPVAVTPAPEDGDLLRRFIGHRVDVRLTSGETITGTINIVAKFSLLLTLTDGTATVLMKNATASVCEKAKT
jgi:hypothetical protein